MHETRPPGPGTPTPWACAEVAPVLSALADGELQGAAAVAVNLHLALCDGCRGHSQSLQLLKSRVAQAVQGWEPAAGVLGRLRDMLHSRGGQG